MVIAKQESTGGVELQGSFGQEFGIMLAGAKACRVHALECVRLARNSALAKERKTFAELARIWLRLASIFEQTQLNQRIEHEPERRNAS